MAGDTATTLYRFFIGLQISGAIGMALILSTAIFSSIVKRCSTWYTFCLSWTISCVAYCLLFFAGGRDQTYVPGSRLCITQAAFMYSVPSLTSLSTLALLIHSWYNVHFGLSLPPLETHHKAVIAFLIAPFSVWFLFFLAFLSFGFSNPSSYNAWIVYLTVPLIRPRAKISSLFVIVIACSMLPVQASLGLSLCRNLYSNESNRRLSVPTLKVVIRVMIFSVLTLVAFGDGVIHVFDKNPGEYVDIIMAWLPVSGVLIFGIQRDILQTWAMWARRLPNARQPREQKKSANTSPTLPALTPDNSP
ncbi:hypothetical protein BDZ89DRAFT_1133230 [Hymenopellis radicata]|nr:hypothetical protein BDZ89DRAFT_1133230 [Hymenopellis radicata]